MKTVPLGGKKAAGRVALVDDGDYDLVMQYRWHVSEFPRPRAGRSRGPYAHATTYPEGRRTTISMHALISRYPQTDHKDHNGLNNQRSNLRPATDVQNSANRLPQLERSSAFKGVRWRKYRNGGGCWRASIMSNGVVYRLGHFAVEEDAARAYDAAARRLSGEFAYTNF